MTPKEFIERFSYNKSTDRLGKGGFGTVFKAWDNANDCYVALKMQAVDWDYPSARLKAEVERAETLNHRNVAKYKECYTFETMEGSMDVAVMSYYENGSLEDLIQGQQLNSEERASILRQMLEGIAYLHNHDIIHRDLKPQNILILHHGGRYTPKITDFGISKQLRDGESGSVRNSLPILSRPYASPEQFLGGTIKKNTDLWSFGVIAYRMFTGSLPFNTSEFDFNSITGRESFFNLLKSGQLPDAVATIPEPWQRLIRACLTSSTELRPAHAEDCLQILGTFKEVVPEPPVSPEPPEPEEEIYVAEVIEATPEDLATESEVKLNPEPKEKSNPKSTKPKTKKRSKWWLWLLLLVVVAVGGAFALFSSNSDISEPTGHINGYGYVDLGLPSGLKWATCNVGASSPEEYGDYFAWGETSPKSSYTEDNCSTEEQNIGDIAGTSRDAARQNWGGSWRMPRASEIDELLSQCTWTWTTQNGNDGYKVTGPNGNSIFLPAAGYRHRASSYNVGSGGLYWISTPYESNAQYAYGLSFHSRRHDRYWYSRYFGLSVRPVSE